MIHRPKGLLLYSLVCVAIAASFPLQIIWLFDFSMAEVPRVFGMLTFSNWVVILGLLALSHAAYHGDKAFNWLAPLNMLLVATNNYWVGSVGETYNAQQALLATGAFSLFAFSPYLLPRARKALMDPKMRWWRAETRFNRQIPITIILEDQSEISDLLTFDISRSGVFIESVLNDYHGLQSGDRVSLRWQGPGEEVFERNAEVVRTAEARGKYPRGMGVRFDYSAPMDSFV